MENAFRHCMAQNNIFVYEKCFVQPQNLLKNMSGRTSCGLLWFSEYDVVNRFILLSHERMIKINISEFSIVHHK